MTKTLKFINHAATILLALLSLTAMSCSDADEGNDDISLTIDWNIDEEKTICLEDYIPNIGKNCEISRIDNEMVSVEYVDSRDLHILHPVKRFGKMKPIITTASGRKYYLTLWVYNDIVCETWELDTDIYGERCIEKDIVCNADIRDDIEADLKEGNVLWNNLRFFSFKTDDIIRYWTYCTFYYEGNGDGSEDGSDYYKREKVFYYHDINTDYYTFLDGDDIYCHQTMKVSLTAKSAMTGRNKFYKKADFEFDITKEMQDKYGAENVKKASMVYHLRNFIFL